MRNIYILYFREKLCHCQPYAVIFTFSSTPIFIRNWSMHPKVHAENFSRRYMCVCIATAVDFSIQVQMNQWKIVWLPVWMNLMLLLEVVLSLVRVSIPLLWRPLSSLLVSSSSTMFNHLLLWNRFANQSQIVYGASLGRGNESLYKWSRSHDKDGRHARMW